jgi:hypothetical protein
MPGGFDFSAFEQESAQLLAKMRASAERLGTLEGDMRAGKVSQAETQAARGPAASETSTGAGVGEADLRARGLATDQLAAKQRALSEATATSSNSERMMAQSMAGNNVGMQKAGALNNEFIESAKRGNVTLGEMGAQLTQVTAKFGLWVVAGAGVYGIFAALSEIKTGAIDAASGVQKLTAVIDNLNQTTAMSQVQGLSGQFNLPIKDVTDAYFQMGKVFHTQNGALQGTTSVLGAMKLGEMDAATATQYLVGAVESFHMPASRMAEVLDQVTQAQRRFGVPMQDIFQGISKAGSIFHGASGEFQKYGQDFSYLTSLITSAAKITGQPGSAIGTAISRGVVSIQKPATQNLLEQFGIDPTGSIESTINQAFAIAKTLTRKQVNQLAADIGGGVRGAKVWSAILGDPQQFLQVQKETSPAASKGAASEELSRVLGTVQEQIAKIGITFGRIGEGLVSSHILDSLGLLLKLLNETLLGVNTLVQAFDKLPGPLKEAVSWGLQLALALRVMRGFNIGPIGGALGGGMLRDAKTFQEGARTTVGAYQTSIDTAGTGALAASHRANIVGPQMVGAQADLATLKQQGATAEELTAAQTRVNALEQEFTSAQELMVKLKLDEAAAQEGLIGAQASLAATQQGTGLFPSKLNVKNALAEKMRLQQEGTAALQQGAAGVVPVAAAAESDAAAAASTSEKAGGRLSALGSKVTGLNGALGGFRGGLSGLVGKAGTLMFVAFGVSLLLDQLSQMTKNIGKEFDAISAGATSAKEAAQQAKDNAARAQGGNTFSESAGSFLGRFGALDPFSGDFGNLSSLTGTSNNLGDVRRQTAAIAAETNKQTLALQQQEQNKGVTVQFRFAADIAKNILELRSSGESQAKIRDGLAKYGDQLNQSMEKLNAPGAGGTQKAQADYAKAEAILNASKADSAKNADLVQALQLLPVKDIEARLQATIGQVGGQYGVAYDPGQAKRAAVIYEAQAQKIGTANDAASLQQLATARQQYFSGLQSAVANELQYALDLARSPGDRAQAYAQAFARYRDFANSSNAEVTKAAARVKQLERQRSTLQGGPLPGSAESHQYGVSSDPQAVKALDEQIKAETEKLKQLKEGEAQKRAYMKDIVAQLRQQMFQAQDAIRQAQETAKEALTADPILQTREQLKFLGNEIELAIKVYGKDSQQVLTLIAQQRKAQQQLVQDQLSIMQSEAGLQQAGILQQIPKEKVALYGNSGLVAQLQFVKSHASQFDPKTLIDLEAQVKTAEAQLAFDIIAQATQVKDAQLGIAEARATAAGDPARAAQLAVQQARYDVSHAQTPLDKLNAEAKLIQSVAAKRDAVAQARLDSISFEANIAKISTQQEIDQLQTMLGTYKLSLQMRRQIREQIHSLKDQLSSQGQAFNLNVGDFALPTAYDIRRAVLGGSGGPRTTVTQTNHFLINNHSSNPNVVGDAIGKVLGGAAESAARSAGVAG